MYSWNNTYTGDTIRRVRLTAVCDRMYGGEFGGGGGIGAHGYTVSPTRCGIRGFRVKKKAKENGVAVGSKALAR